MAQQLQIAIDGPASSGKSTIAKKTAEILKFVYIDTGAMYRALTYEALNQGINVSDEQSLMDLLSDMYITFSYDEEGQKVCINGRDVTADIRETEVSQNVSEVAAHPLVREKLVELQRKLAGEHSVIMDGRDIGTVVLPQADVKIFLVASAEERARRRQKENESRGIQTNFEEVKRDLIRRDKIDSNREHSPLKKADDAIELDTTGLSIDEVVNKVLKIIEEI